MIIISLILIIIAIIITEKRGIPWFLYHHIGENGVSKEWFEEHLKIIDRLKMKTLRNRDVKTTLEEKGKLDKNSILLTFDDGYYNNYKYAHPLLKKYNMKATIYLNTAYMEDEKNRKFEYLSWKEIEEMSESGVWDIQLHSHRHMPIFVNINLERVVEEKDLLDRDIQYLYSGKAKVGYPILGKRGEYSSKGIIVTEHAAEKFKNFYDNLNLEYPEKIKECQKYIDTSLKDWFKYEDDTMAERRISMDLDENIRKIKEHCKITPTFFCWPWGHKNKMTVDIMKRKGIYGFVTTRKGTNSLKIDVENIKRVELRKFTPLKFKLNVLVTRNYFLGRVYQLLS